VINDKVLDDEITRATTEIIPNTIEAIILVECACLLSHFTLDLPKKKYLTCYTLLFTLFFSPLNLCQQDIGGGVIIGKQ